MTQSAPLISIRACPGAMWEVYQQGRILIGVASSRPEAEQIADEARRAYEERNI